jgi:hypothetical protein
MSIARLAGLIARAAAPAARTHRTMPEGVQPAFDAPAAIGTAMLGAGIAAAPPPPALRRAASAAPAIPSPQPVRHRIEARMAEPASRAVTQPSAAALEPPSTGEVPPPPVLAPGRVTVTPAASDGAPEIATLPPVRQAAPMPSMPLPIPLPMRAAEAGASMPGSIDRPALVVPSQEPAAALAPGAVAAPAALPQRVTAERAAMPATGPAPAASAAPAPPPISIGTVEVVIAAPPPRPAPAPRPAPDRSFTRYAAMRSGRDRAW